MFPAKTLIIIFLQNLFYCERQQSKNFKDTENEIHLILPFLEPCQSQTMGHSSTVVSDQTSLMVLQSRLAELYLNERSSNRPRFVNLD